MAIETTRPKSEYNPPTSRTATLDGCYASDQINRPVGYRGRVYYVNSERSHDNPIVAGVSCMVAATRLESMKVPAWFDMPFDTIDLSESIPLCLDCCQPLERSEVEVPGTCPNEACFLGGRGMGEWDDQAMDGIGAWI